MDALNPTAIVSKTERAKQTHKQTERRARLVPEQTLRALPPSPGSRPAPVHLGQDYARCKLLISKSHTTPPTQRKQRLLRCTRTPTHINNQECVPKLLL